jgi:leucyl aminopeptidase
MAVRFVVESETARERTRLDRATGGAYTRGVRAGDVTGRFLETALVHPPERAGARRVLLVGLGHRGALVPQRVLQATALAAGRARAVGAGTLDVILPADLGEDIWAHAAAEGAVLGHHRFSAYRTTPAPAPLRSVDVIAERGAVTRAHAAAVARGARWGEATCIARDLAATPGQDLVPERLAARATEVAEATGATARILRGAQLERLGMGCVLAVGRGSPNPPCVVVLEHAPAAERSARRGARARGGGAARVPTIVLVGKGVTFDTGGISLKPREDMTRMKYDMSGAAAVIGVFSALPTLAPAARIIGILPCAENMPDGVAYKPGDVLRAMDGSTIEVTNTDAEGRLLLADALCYARTFSPDTVIDVATLTGAIRIALGTYAAGMFTANDALADSLLAASAATGERLWRMPLWPELYGNELRSEVADTVNSATRDGGACIAAAFLSRFTRGMRWAHLDIAGRGWNGADQPHEPKGPTGFGVRLLLEWLRLSERYTRPAPE